MIAVVQLALICLFGYLGYREASKFERDNGRPAFGIPAWGWALITACSLLIGAVLLYVARRSAAKNPAPVAAPPAASSVAPFGWAAGPPPAQPENLWAAPMTAQNATQFGTPPAGPAPVPQAPANAADVWAAPPPPPPAPSFPAAPTGPAMGSRDILPGR